MAKPSKSKATTAKKAAASANAGRKTKRTGTKKRTPRKPTSLRENSQARPATKIARLIALLGMENGATISDLTKATGWQAHSVRGAISGTLKKKLGLRVTSEPVEGRGRVYRIADHD